MTKKQLIDMLDKDSIIKCSANYKDYYSEYCLLIEGLLYAVGNDEEIHISSLERFEGKKSFDMFVRSNDSNSSSGIQNICEALSNIVAELKTWKKNYTVSNPEKITDAVAVLMLKNRLDIKRQNRVKKSSIIFLSIFITVSSALFIFALLGVLGVFPEKSTMESACNIIVAVLGVFDFANGVVAFVWERVNDLKKKSDDKIIKEAAEKNDPKIIVKVENSKIIKCGCCSKID